ncbi:MAG: FtsX-like permease family protein [Tissierellia bacterium]|nr:FtsX-like permease family protein [Tissierellia bacterium]
MKDLNTIGLAKKNIKNKKGRSYGLMGLTGILCFILFMSSFVILSLRNGMSSLSHRLGADLIVVPQGYDSNITGAILRGEPNTFFFDRSVMDRVDKIEGVEKTSPEFFLATLSAGCCSFPIQVIGIDFEKDFTVVPWLRDQVKLPLKEGEIVGGNNIVGDFQHNVKFFNKSFHLKGKLAKTGMGFDNSVFMTMKEAKALAKEYEKILGEPIAAKDDIISSVMVKVEKGVDPKIVSDRIRAEFKGEMIYPLMSKQMMSEVSKNVENLLIYVYILIGLLWILAFFVLSLVYSISIKERKREFAILRIMGATKKKLRSICLSEILLINAIGAFVGTTCSFVISILFSRALREMTNLPFLSPSISGMLLLAIVTIVLGIVIGPLSSLYGLTQMNKREPALLLREND